MRTIDVEIRPEGHFLAKCIKTCDDRFILGKVYPCILRHTMSGHSYYGILDEHGREAGNGTNFKNWYKDCVWVDYDFEEV